MNGILVRTALVAVWAMAPLAVAHYRADRAAGLFVATGLGVHDAELRLDDVSAGAVAARLHRECDALRRLGPSGLSQRDRDDALLWPSSSAEGGRTRVRLPRCGLVDASTLG